ncbi:MAG: amidohydrolase family protein [Actinomycetaceae bacterium]|nr:amidohydrolase family protein [Actinomycetaceae bacterium]
MILRGWMLTDEGGAPTHNPAWTYGTWQVAGGHLHPVEDTGPADLEGFFLPGFVDVHCHIGIGETGPVDEEEQRRQIHADLASGVLLIRDCGSPVDTTWVNSEPDLPALIRCGQHIAREKRYIRGLARNVEPADLAQAVAQQAARSNGWVKLVGDWIDRSGGAEADLEPLWPLPALKDAVSAAHEAGARVAVHAFSHRVIDDLLEAGVDDIEHGTGMDANHMAEAAARGIAVTPTLLQVELFNDFADQAGAKYPVYAATMRALYEGRRDHSAALFDSGVTILPGTDSGGYQDHGCLGDELRAWADLGVDYERILALATTGARRYLGVAPEGEGALADVVFFRSDPRTNPAMWGRPDAVIRGGHVVAGGA